MTLLALLSFPLLFLPNLASIAQAQDSCTTAQMVDYVAQVEDRGDPDAYSCLIQLDEAGPFLLDRVQQTTTPDTGLTRALAVHWMPRLDTPLSEDVARALNPSDRRLLSDAVRARRGRKSPAPDHDKVFSQFDWYQPIESYTDKRLTPVDRANLQLLASPPPPPKPSPEASAAEAIAQAAATPATERGCQGCATPSSSPLPPTFPIFLSLIAVILWRRRPA